jgi:hypothetical protein
MILGIYEIFSKRLRKRERAGQPDVYQYEELPQPLRVQIIHIWDDAIGPSVRNRTYTGSRKIWEFIDNGLSREMGIFHLGGDPYAEPEVRCKQFLLNASTNQALDMIELSFRCVKNIDGVLRWNEREAITQDGADAIKELNYHFKEHGVGYQFVGDEIVRVDSQYVHAEVAKPAISLLNTAGFGGASEEFLKAHEHYRKGRHGEAMSEALKAFESTMKAICDKNGWKCDSNATAKTLIKVLLDNGLVPRYMETHLAGLRNTLEAGLPTVRNKNSGHGQGLLRRNVPDYFAGYALHLAATNIVFLVEAHEVLNQK